MQLAAKRVAETADKVAAVAERIGYDSEAAFSRAFKRLSGLSPGQSRSSKRNEQVSEVRSHPSN